MADEVVQPLGKIFVKIKCNNPTCRKQFSLEMNNEECLTRCPKCLKEYYVHIEGTKVWVKSINNGRMKTH